VEAGLWDKKKTYAKKKMGNDVVNEPVAGYGGLFDNMELA